MRLLFVGLVIYSVLVPAGRNQTLVDSFPSPGGDPRGLAWDGEYLWCADAQEDSVYRLDPSTGQVVSVFPFLIQDSYGGITWSNDSNAWVADGSFVYKVDPSTGEVIFSFSCPGG